MTNKIDKRKEEEEERHSITFKTFTSFKS